MSSRSLIYLTERKRRLLFARFAKIAYNDSKTAKAWGKEEGFTVGLVLLPFIFLPILGFDNSVYTD